MSPPSAHGKPLKSFFNLKIQCEIMAFKELRILHLGFSRDDSDDVESVDEIQASFDQIQLRMQSLATKTFQKLDTSLACPSLKTLVFGSYGAVRKPQQLPRRTYRPLGQQYLFSKGHQYLRGRVRTVAVPITRRQLKDMEPDLDVLDWDQKSEWIGRLPGRIHS